MAVGHTQFVVILLLLAYIATAGASPVKCATARAAPAALTLGQLTSGSARYDTLFPLLTRLEAQQMHAELLAGNEPPPDLHDAVAKCLVIVDTGCGRSMGNHGPRETPTTDCPLVVAPFRYRPVFAHIPAPRN